jgi:hypothetical protein
VLTEEVGAHLALELRYRVEVREPSAPTTKSHSKLLLAVVGEGDPRPVGVQVLNRGGGPDHLLLPGDASLGVYEPRHPVAAGH